MSDVDVEDDSILAALAALPVHEADPRRARRTRSRTRAVLRRRRSRRFLLTAALRIWCRALEPVVVCSAGAAYLAAVIRLALRLYGS